MCLYVCASCVQWLLCLCVFVSVYVRAYVRVCPRSRSFRGRGAVPKARADDNGHLRGAAGGWHRLRGGILQNQVSPKSSLDRQKEPCTLTH